MRSFFCLLLVVFVFFPSGCILDEDDDTIVLPASSRFMSSSSEPMSSSSAEPQPTISCSMDVTTVYESTAITPPTVTCSDDSAPSDIVFDPELDWNNPESGSYEVLAAADCGYGTLPAVSCGELTVDAITLDCGDVPAVGTSSLAIDPPKLTCSNGVTAVPISWTANVPIDWGKPAANTYSDINVLATCGSLTRMADCGGTLTVTDEIILTCGSVPTSGYEGTAIEPPALACSSGAPGTPDWTNAPNWGNPASGPYSSISVTATCGSETKTANCSGELNVAPVALTCGSWPSGTIYEENGCLRLTGS